MNNQEVPWWLWALGVLVLLGILVLIVRSGLLGFILTLVGIALVIAVIYVVVRALNR